MRRLRPEHVRDKALVSRLLAGEEAAYDELFAVQVPRLYRIALSRLGPHAAAAEDVVQATLIRAMAKLRTYLGEGSLLTWLGTFCRHEVSAYHRKHGQKPSQLELREDIPEVKAALELIESAVETPERTALKTEIGRLVRATLDRLPPHYADVLEWKYLEGLSMKEIAARLETGPIAVQSLLGRARRAFRDGFSSVASCAGLAALESPD